MDAWWARLPETLDSLAARWAVAVGEPVDGGNTSLVLRCRRADGRRAMLKLCPEPALTVAEAAALRAWAATGAVPEVWESDAAAGALLLEAIAAEEPLADRAAGAPLDAVGELLRALHAGDRHGFPPLDDRVAFVLEHWIARVARDERARRAVPLARLEQGAALARALAADPVEPVLLHGDFHPGNVLDGGAGRGLVAIDPRPCAGDPAFDAVDWVFHGAPDPAEWRPRSRTLAAAAGCDADRLWAWCTAFAALLAGSGAARGRPAAEVAALLALAGDA